MMNSGFVAKEGISVKGTTCPDQKLPAGENAVKLISRMTGMEERVGKVWMTGMEEINGGEVGTTCPDQKLPAGENAVKLISRMKGMDVFFG